ncbi:MAG: ComEC/Rec2 family competence protein, partial [Desulfobulbaceae bacterium]|nr:ComEC/Rec2 family competence protein [Desulfobulbaceae bacterium]
MACQPSAANINTVAYSPLASLIPSVIAFTAGIFFATKLNTFAPPILFWSTLATTAIAVLLAFCKHRHQWAFALLILLFFTLGIIRSAPFAQKPQSQLNIYNQIQSRTEASVVGVLTQMPARPFGGSRILIAAEQLIFPDGTITPTKGLIMLTMPGRLPNDIEPGNRLIARATLKRPRSFLTPGVFDYEKHLANKNIHITGWVSSPAVLHKVQQQHPPSISEQLHYLPERLRHRVGIFLEKTLDQQTSALYRALLLGDRSAIAPAIIENFTTTGCVHLLAISGTHMGLIALLITFAAAWLLKRSTRLILFLPIWKTAALIALPPLAAYAMLAGFQTPAVRALAMTTVFLFAILMDRQWSIPVNIAIAAFLLLVWKPVLIHTASFQLSFTAVLAITLLYPQITTLFTPPKSATRSIYHKLRHWLIAGLLVSTAATVGVIPLSLLHFNRLSILSPISTLLIEPFLCLWSLTIGLASCLLLPVSSWLASNLLHLGGLGLSCSVFLSKTLATIPYTSFRLPTPTPAEITLYYLALIAFSQRQRIRFSQPVAITALLALLGTFSLNSALASQNKNLRVNILDVGQGSAIVLELPHNRAILIDGGSYLGNQFDVGERIIAPFLWSRQINKLE